VWSSPASTLASSRQQRRRLDLGVLAAFVLVAFVVFWPALSGEFVSDDLNAIVSNERVTGGHSLIEIFSTFSWWGGARADAPGYRPLTTWSFALNHDLAGSNVFSWHAVNVLLHAVIAWLVYLLAMELGAQAVGAVAAGSLFLVLPIHVEAVAWIVGRAELFATLAYATGLLFVLRHRRTRGAGYAVAGALVIALGCFAKENAATLLVAPAFAAVVLGGGARERRRDGTMLAALAIGILAYGAVRFVADGASTTSAAGDLLDNPLSPLPIGTRLLGALSVLGRYLALTIWPHPLSVDYSFDALGIGPGFLADRYTAFALLGLSGLAVAGYTRGRRAVFPLLLAGASFSLVSNTALLIGTVMAERLFYLPTLGLVLAVVPAYEAAVAATARGGRALLIASALVCIVYAGVSFRRAHDWQSSVSLFESAVRVHPRSARAHMELGGAYGRVSRVEDAEREFAAAVDVLPTYAAAWYNLGNLRARDGRLDDAASAYRRALESAPKLVQAWFNLGLVEQMRGRRDDAIGAFSAAAKIAPGDAEIARALAGLQASDGYIANPPSGR
jgi:tetratricopeptide (TPR) repeat protein